MPAMYMPIPDHNLNNKVATVAAGDIDRTMLLSIWVKYLEQRGRKIIFAGMGNPTYPINRDIVSEELRYWADVLQKSQDASEALDEYSRLLADGDDAEAETSLNLVAAINGTVPYANPSGIIDARTIAAEALNKWYPNLTAKADDILLPVGGSSALYAIFDFINESKDPNGVIVTAFPYYSLYKGNKGQNNLHPIHVMQEPGYKLTAHALEESLKVADRDGLPINAYLFCDPNNPLATVTDKEEWVKIALLLRERLKHEQSLPLDKRTPIVVDEAYAEMGLFKKPTSLLTVLMETAPELLNHVILMRSATKGLSAAGERMALLYSANSAFINKCLTPGLNIYGHMPVSAHRSFAQGLNGLTENKLKKMRDYYAPQVKLVCDRAEAIGVNMPDPLYKPEGTFYILLDLHELIGARLNADAKAAVGDKEFIENDQDICYHLLFEEGVMIGPISYSGINAKKGFVRVTCSGGYQQLNLLMDKISDQITRARKAKNEKLLEELAHESGLLRRAIKIREAKNVGDSPILSALTSSSSPSSSPSSSISNDTELLTGENLKAEINKKLTPKSQVSPELQKADKVHRDSTGSSDSDKSEGSNKSEGSDSSAKIKEKLKQEKIKERLEKIKERAEKAAVAKSLKDENNELRVLLAKTKDSIRTLSPEAKALYELKQEKAAVKIEKIYRGHSQRTAYQAFKEAQKEAQAAIAKLNATGARVGGKASSTLSWKLNKNNKTSEQTTIHFETTPCVYTQIHVKKK
jgi:aspartate aminotransferase/aminotransferase